MIGAITGLFLAAFLTYLIMKATIRLNLHKFFLFTGSLIIFIAGGLMSHITMGLQEIGILLFLREKAWNLSFLIPNDSLLGKILHAFIGYEASPTILQMIIYLLYIAFMLYILWKGFNFRLKFNKRK